MAVAMIERPRSAGPGGMPGSAGVSAAGVHAAAILEARADRATSQGTALGALLQDPEALARAFRATFKKLADREYRVGQERVAPGIGSTFGVRLPLQAAVRRAFTKATRTDSPALLLLAADRLLHEPELEAHWFALSILERTIAAEPERSWQLLRRVAASAADWITVDTLAHPVGLGILREPRRWPELEQLTISPSRWERRLVGSTIATLPFIDHRAGRTPEVAARSLAILATLIGDREPDVQKALSWAYRSMLMIDRDATIGALEAEAKRATETDDGNRAWVVRDVLPKLDPDRAATIRAALAGIRRRPGAPSTSDAAELAGRFAGMGLGRTMPEPPLT
jgi:3-methyladenine DNA glycosylase AlkD